MQGRGTQPDGMQLFLPLILAMRNVMISYVKVRNVMVRKLWLFVHFRTRKHLLPVALPQNQTTTNSLRELSFQFTARLNWRVDNYQNCIEGDK